MSQQTRSVRRSFTFALLVAVPFVAGCAGRAAPFDQLDKSTITILKLQAAAPLPTTPQQLGPDCGQFLPFLTPDMQAWCQQILQGLKGLPIPIPGLTPPAPQQPPVQQVAMFRGQWQIADSRPIMQEPLREQLLDLFGKGENFNQAVQCPLQTPSMAVQFQSPAFAEPVDVVVSISCNTVQGFGFMWPHENNFGMSPQAQQLLHGIYQSMNWGQLPQGG